MKEMTLENYLDQISELTLQPRPDAAFSVARLAADQDIPELEAAKKWLEDLQKQLAEPTPKFPELEGVSDEEKRNLIAFRHAIPVEAVDPLIDTAHKIFGHDREFAINAMASAAKLHMEFGQIPPEVRVHLMMRLFVFMNVMQKCDMARQHDKSIPKVDHYSQIDKDLRENIEDDYIRSFFMFIEHQSIDLESTIKAFKNDTKSSTEEN